MKWLIFAIMALYSMNGMSQNSLTVMTTNEANEPTRIQHVYNVEDGNFALRGINNFDLAGDAEVNRYQLKPRLSYSVPVAESVLIQGVVQQEWFWTELRVKTPRGIVQKEVRSSSTRTGIGLVTKTMGIINEANLYLYDDLTEGGRFENLTSYRIDRWTLSNQYWMDAKSKSSFDLLAVSYALTRSLQVTLQGNTISGKDNVVRVGACWQF